MAPCFKVVQTSPHTFRGTIFGLSFAYCDFTGRGGRMELARSGRYRGAVRLRERGQPGLEPHPFAGKMMHVVLAWA